MRTRVTSGRHEYVLLDEFTCAVLEHLDGYSDKQLVFKKLKKRKRTNLTVESGSKTTQINLKKIDKASFFEWWEHVMPELARRGVLLKA